MNKNDSKNHNFKDTKFYNPLKSFILLLANFKKIQLYA